MTTSHEKGTNNFHCFLPAHNRKKPWRMTGGENFCKKCMTDKSFLIKNYKTCTDQCVHRMV